jgi:hypothetical protein
MKQSIKYKTPSQFTVEEQHLIINDYLTSGQTKDSVWLKYVGKKDHGRLLVWMRNLGYAPALQGIKLNVAKGVKPMSKRKNQQDPIDQDFETLQLKKRISELEKQLRDAELKAIAFSTMVDIAEKEFNIPIRKKYNTKP